MIPAVQRNARFSSVGAWRSLVAHLHGVQGVEGSNPSVPTNFQTGLDQYRSTETNTNQCFNSGFLSGALGSSGLVRAPLGHKYVTNTDRALGISSCDGAESSFNFRKKVFDKHKPLSVSLAHHFVKISRDQDFKAAEPALRNIDQRLQVKDLKLTSSDKELRAFCEYRASTNKLFSEKHLANSSYVYKRLCDLVVEYGMEPPLVDSYNTEMSCINRVICKSWWLRKVRRHRARVIESVSRDIGLVNKASGSYCSKFGQALYNEQQSRNAELLRSMIATNTDGQSYSLSDLRALSVSNPEIRRAEFMTRMKGFEIVAKLLGHSCGFFTITCPSKMHAWSQSGKQYDNYDGTSPKVANDYLANLWAVIRASLARKSVKVYGFRIAEPHHDGTPHWHLLLFYNQQDLTTVTSVMRHYALAEDPNEPGADRHRFKFEEIDPAKGSAAAYVAKYVSKNIDGHGLEEDLYGNDAKQSAKSITAWASIWGIRQFQQIGGPSVTVWRELRRLDYDGDDILADATKAADESDWAAYVMTMGGPTLPNSERPITTASLIEDGENLSTKLDVDTGELFDCPPNRYGSLPRGKVLGVWHLGKLIVTRCIKWKIERLPKPADPNSLFAHGLMPLSERANCAVQRAASTLRPLDSCQ